jgi:hypothetical protein
MTVSVAMFALIAEDVVHVVEGVLKLVGISQSFMGLTLIALTPAATELASAIKFALAGQINLSVEIGSASAVQVCLHPLYSSSYAFGSNHFCSDFFDSNASIDIDLCHCQRLYKVWPAFQSHLPSSWSFCSYVCSHHFQLHCCRWYAIVFVFVFLKELFALPSPI